MKTKAQDGKRAAANDREVENTAAVVELVGENDVPTTLRATKSAFADTQEWRDGVSKIGAGIPAGKAVKIGLSAETLGLGKNSRITFKRLLMSHCKRMRWNYAVSLRGNELFVSNAKKK